MYFSRFLIKKQPHLCCWTFPVITLSFVISLIVGILSCFSELVKYLQQINIAHTEHLAPQQDQMLTYSVWWRVTQHIWLWYFSERNIYFPTGKSNLNCSFRYILLKSNPFGGKIDCTSLFSASITCSVSFLLLCVRQKQYTSRVSCGKREVTLI